MITKSNLLLRASTKSDAKRLDRLLEYDHQQNGIMLYRYRHISKETIYEIDALSKCQIWASNPEYFDDEFEFIPSCNSRNDYECMRYFIKRELERRYGGRKSKKYIAEVDKFYHKNPRILTNIFLRELKNARHEYAVSCFSENAPFDKSNNMWHQYAKDSGICLGYSLSSLVKAKIIIDPVYYVDLGSKSLGNMFNLFGKNCRTALCFCIKDKYGIDKYADNPKTICWEDQNEWRYAINNFVDKSTNEYAKGCYLEKKIVPDVIYIKNLGVGLVYKVWMAARQNRIPLKYVL